MNPSCVKFYYELGSSFDFFYQMSSSTDPKDSGNRYGWVPFAESWNGRLAMLGLLVGLATEILTGQGILSQIGLG